MAVEYIEIRGEKYPVKLGYQAFKKLQKKHGLSITDISSVDWENYEPALFYALETGADEDNIPFTFKMADMPKVLEDCLWAFVDLMPKFFPKVDEELAKTLAVSLKKETTTKKPPTGQTRKKVPQKK